MPTDKRINQIEVSFWGFAATKKSFAVPEGLLQGLRVIHLFWILVHLSTHNETSTIKLDIYI